MWKKVNPIFLGIILCFTFLIILFANQACKKDRSSTDQTVSLDISGILSWSPDGQKVAFISRRYANAEIYIMNANGSDQTRLTSDPANDMSPSWSPDGSKIAFQSDRDGNMEVYIMNTDGSDQSRLTDNPAGNGMPSWSPDGTRIAFASGREGNAEIYIMNADGSNQTRLTNNPANDFYPSCSPDGKKISFASDRDGNAEIYIMNADGSDQSRLTDKPGRDFFPSWSLDGTQIVFESKKVGHQEIYIMNADGSDLARLTDDPSNNARPSWSPDGTKIYFSSDRDFKFEVYVMDADGSNPVRLTYNAPVNKTAGLAPLPQSELVLDEIPYKIVYETYRETNSMENWEICMIDADGSGFVNLTNTPEIDEFYPHASPDGTRVCFVAFEGEDNQTKSRNVYAMNIDGTGRVKITENAFQPCWSADSKYIAYLPGEYPKFNLSLTANKGLEIYDLETGKVNQHPNDKIQHLWCPCWSPDGEWFTATKRGGNIAFKANDKTMVVLSASGCRPDISADGTRLVWGSEDWFFNIGTLNFESSPNNVTDHKVVVACEREYWIYHVDWSPDGKYLTFSYAPYEGSESVGRKAPGSNICICDLRTGKWSLVTTDGKHNKEPDWVPVQVR